MNQLFDFVSTSGTVLLTVLGLFVILGLMNIINLAQTGFMAVGVYAAVSLSHSGVPFFFAVLLAGAIVGLVALILEVTIIRRIYGRPLDAILATYGASLIILQAITLIYGSTPESLNSPISGTIHAAGQRFPIYPVFLFVLALVFVGVLWLWSRLTRVGLVVRMVMSNEALAQGRGIDIRRVRTATFVFGSAVSGLAGALLGPISSISPQYASLLLVPAFLAVLLSGKRLSALLIAVAALSCIEVGLNEFTTPAFSSLAIILVALTALRIRPSGLQG